MTIQERKEIMLKARAEGYNCAQSLLLAFEDRLPLQRDELAALAASLGAGLGCGEICGVANAMSIAKGLSLKASTPAMKVQAMKEGAALARRFEELNGALRCADLKGVPGKKTCNELIADGVEILDAALHL